MPAKLDLRGQRFGKLLVIGYDYERSNKAGHSYFICVCDCGKQTTASGNALKSGKSQSCGCNRGKHNAYTAFHRKHGCDVCADAKNCPKEFCKYERLMENEASDV